jgi:hypothetical protein
LQHRRNCFGNVKEIYDIVCEWKKRRRSNASQTGHYALATLVRVEGSEPLARSHGQQGCGKSFSV